MDKKIIQEAIRTLQNVPFRELQRMGYHFQRNDFYSPLNDCDFLEANPDLWSTPYEAPCIDWNLDGQISVAREVAQFVHELEDIPDSSDDKSGFHWNNNFWSNADPIVQYGLCRSRQPRRVVEIGCGWSSLLLARALERNDSPSDVTLIEPYPRRDLLARLPSHWVLEETIIQRAPLDTFDALQAGDILFYDGSHCCKVASDVNWFFFRILPSVSADQFPRLFAADR